jgi:hypothetical protein
MKGVYMKTLKSLKPLCQELVELGKEYNKNTDAFDAVFDVEQYLSKFSDEIKNLLYTIPPTCEENKIGTDAKGNTWYLALAYDECEEIYFRLFSKDGDKWLEDYSFKNFFRENGYVAGLDFSIEMTLRHAINLYTEKVIESRKMINPKSL